MYCVFNDFKAVPPGIAGAYGLLRRWRSVPCGRRTCRRTTDSSILSVRDPGMPSFHLCGRTPGSPSAIRSADNRSYTGFPAPSFLCRGIADIHRRNRRVAFCGSCRLRSYTAKNRIPVSCRRGPNIRCRGSLPAGPRCKRCNRGRTGRSFLRDNPFHSCFKGRDDCRRPCNIQKKS